MSSSTSRTPRKRVAQGQKSKETGPLPALSDWIPQPPSFVPPSRASQDLTYNQQKRQSVAREALNNRDQLIWYAAARNDSLAQTELYFTKMLHRPQEKPDQGRTLCTDLKIGPKVPDEIMRLVREDEGKYPGQTETKRQDTDGTAKTKKAKRGTDKGKEKSTTVTTQERVGAQDGDAMDIDEDEEEEEEEGGVPVVPAPTRPAKRRID